MGAYGLDKNVKNIPIFILNFKNYPEVAGHKSIELAKAAQQVAKSFNGRLEIVVASPQPALSLLAKFVDIPVFAQHLDDIEEGSTTGFFVPEMAHSFGAHGSLINHSEHRIESSNVIQSLVNRLKKLQMVSVVCAHSSLEVSNFAVFEPDYIAIEPPELIGTGKAVSKESPSVIRESVDAAAKISKNVKLICGAGITEAADVKSALRLGAQGILVASGVIKAAGWFDKIAELASGYEGS